MTDEALAEAYRHCESLAKEHRRDHWIAALFAPEPARRHLHALNAFAFETAKVKAIVREPLAGEMRLTWWIEAIDGVREAEAKNHPVAAALLATIAAASLPKARFEDWLLARRDELYREAPEAEVEIAALGRAVEAPLFALSALALGAAADDAAGRAGEARALLAAALPEAALGRIELAEAALAGVATVVLPAFAPLVAMRLDARRALRGKGPAPGWRRQIAIWRWGR